MRGRVTAEDTGQPLEHAVVEIVEVRRTELTDSAGLYWFDSIPAGRLEITARAFGYAELSTEVDSDGAGELRVDFVLRPQPLRLRPLTAVGRRAQEGGTVERALWEREPSVGLVGVSGREIRDVPAMAEPDVLRALQALPDVVPLNDLSARLHVQGGGPDQNMYLWDGARVFAPYHMFGMFGSFNADAVGRSEFYRGHLPARYGGVLSSVLEISPLASTTEPLQGLAAFGLLGLRATVRGRVADGDGQWLLAGRRTHVDLVGDQVVRGDFPYAFFDAQGYGSLRVSPHDRIAASGFVSGDRFSMFLDGLEGGMSSQWENGALSARWTREKGEAATTVRAWASRYFGSLRAGSAETSPTTENELTAGGLGVERARQGSRAGYRVGLEVEAGALSLMGSDPAAYIASQVDDEYLQFAGYSELEWWVGPIRFRPGLRVTHEIAHNRTFVAPRLAARLRLGDDAAVTAGVERTHQFLSTLQDDRFVVPGAPFWLLHPDGRPASRSDRVSVAFEMWIRREWSLEVGGYARRFRDVLRWQPIGQRTADQVFFDDGAAAGASFMLRRHEGRFTGWLGYSVSRAVLRRADADVGYFAPWDRTQAVDGAVFFKPSRRVTLSARLAYSSGSPFWPQSGEVDGQRFSPQEGTIELGGEYPIWADFQYRFPAQVRWDVAVRFAFSALGLDLEGYAGMLNAGLESNVLYYTYGIVLDGSGNEERVQLEPTHILPAFPSFGLTVRF